MQLNLTIIDLTLGTSETHLMDMADTGLIVCKIYPKEETTSVITSDTTITVTSDIETTITTSSETKEEDTESTSSLPINPFSFFLGLIISVKVIRRRRMINW